MKKKFILLFILLFLCSCTKLEVPTSKGQVIPEEQTNIVNQEVLKAHFLDVAQADSIFIELPNNKTMLIDGGEAWSSSKIITYIESLGYKKIDYILATHPHADHIGGLNKIIDYFEIGTIYMPKVVATSKTYENLLNTIGNKGLKIKKGAAGVEVLNEENLKAIIVAPTEDKYSSYNNYSLVLKLTYQDTTYLFTGDAEEVSEKSITADIKSDVLKVGHHGSKTSSSSNFLKRVSPKYAVISVGADNKYNHPASETLTKLQEYTNNIYRTDLHGNITITSDGKNIKVITEK